MSTDPLWRTAEAAVLIEGRQAGALIRLGRTRHGWRQADLGRRLGCSASTISRLERHGTGDLGLLRHAAREVGLPTDVLAAAVLFDAGRHAQLLETLPTLLADAHAAARTGSQSAYATLSSCYSLVSRVLTKIGRYERSRLTADRALTYADLSGSAIATAEASRELSIVLRHQDQPHAAQRLVDRALATVERTGLATQAQAMAYAQMLCTTAYTAARAGDRDQALTLMREAGRAATRLPDHSPAGAVFSISPAAVTLYEVGVYWAIGDAGAALHSGRSLHPAQFSTAERRARMHTDLARAWWQWDKPQQTADALLHALRVSPAEVRDRPVIRRVAGDLIDRHPRTVGVRELASALGTRVRAGSG
ncbi:helix-turn-helix domain-containing protein [Streptomyces hesseae]|uniref:Helix-turn-helix transcriptional regulator n=1 Tax=Streptomyces hesseae TaxID=3075519 RepID=A0ABU2SSY1_9ACTN|nr:helix-turn-helix transcriptional regulator [Streptomyces sp. DSM 40473]MDT0451130.1 helix-turn-helix transcriptional regulator [Streptomyces sp. DSM 40473]